MSAGARAGTPAAVPSGRFSPDALEANRAGRLTDEQRRQLGGMDHDWRRSWLGMAAVFLAIGLLVATAGGPNPNAALRPLVGGAFIALAAIVALRSLPSMDPLSRDLRAGVVESVEGAAEKQRVSTTGRTTTFTTHYLEIGNRRLEIPADEYDGLPVAAELRVFFLPRSHRTVNVERLADAPLPAGAFDAPVATVAHLMSEVATSRGGAHREAMAQVTAFEDAAKAMVTGPAAPPPASERDPRPLAEAIVGSWSNPFATVTFGADGTAALALPGGRTQEGRWSVDASGHLHATAGGRDMTGDAWIAGNVLTLSVDGEALTLRRASAG